ASPTWIEASERRETGPHREHRTRLGHAFWTENDVLTSAGDDLMSAIRRSILALVVVAGGVTWWTLSSRVVAQVPEQDRQPGRAALRPAVMGPSGGVSTGHPLTTAAAFGVLLKGGNAFAAVVASC